MANKYCNLVGTNKVKDEYGKINDGFQEVEDDKLAQDNRMANHVGGSAEKHTANHVTYDDTGNTKVVGNNVHEALDSIEEELRSIIETDANAEVGSAHVSIVKDKTFDDIDARFEEIEQDHMTLSEEVEDSHISLVKVETFDTLPARLEDIEQDHITDIGQVLEDLSSKATQENLNTLQTQVDNIVANAGETGSNAELIDIRLDSKGKTFTTAGEAARNIGRSVNIRRPFASASFLGAGATATITTQDNLEYVKAAISHPSSPSYSYVLLRLDKTRAELLANPIKRALFLSSDFSGIIAVMLTVHQAFGGSMYVTPYTMVASSTIPTKVELDFTDQAVIDYLNTKTETTVYALVILWGSGGANIGTGNHNLTACMTTLENEKGKRQFVDLAKDAYHALTSDTSAEATHTLNSDTAFDVGITRVLKDNLKVIHPGVSITPGVYSVPATITKIATTGSGTFFAVYVKITYNTLSDLDYPFELHFEVISGVNPTNQICVLDALSDWNPSHRPVTIGATMLTNKVNLYDLIMASEYASVYQSMNTLYVVVPYFTGDPATINSAVAVWKINPAFEYGGIVRANAVTDELMELIVSTVSAESVEINELRDVLIIDKTFLGSTGANKNTSYAGNIALVEQVFMSGSNKIGIKYHLYLEGSYVFGYARITPDKVYADLNTKKYKFVIESDVDVVGLKFRLTNNSSWGSTDYTTGKSREVILNLNSSNNRKAIVEIDLSDADIATFYTEYSLQMVYYILVLEQAPIGVEARLSSYVYEVREDIVEDFNQSFIANVNALLLETNDRIESIESDIEDIVASGEFIIYEIVVWGDSLTAGGGWTTQLQTLSGITVKNGGTGGENAVTIRSRQGADVMMVNDITIPADTSEILIATKATDTGINTFFGNKATPLLQGGAHVNPSYISGIAGTLRWTGASYADETGTWVWHRNVAGTLLVVDRPTALITDFDKNHNKGLMIIFMGQNGGYSNDADLINMHKHMIAHSNSKYTIILGLSSGSASSRAAYETAFKAEFGRYFISLREYLSVYGISDAELTATQADTEAMATGTVPPQLLSDAVHFTTACKTVIGNMLYKKLQELNIL